MKKIPGLVGRVRVGAPDASLTAVSGVVAVAGLVGRLGVTAALDDAVGAVKDQLIVKLDRSAGDGATCSFDFVLPSQA